MALKFGTTYKNYIGTLNATAINRNSQVIVLYDNVQSKQ